MSNGQRVTTGVESMAQMAQVLAGSLMRHYEGKEERKLARERMTLEKVRLGTEKYQAATARQGLNIQRRRAALDKEIHAETKVQNIHNRIMNHANLKIAQEDLVIRGQQASTAAGDVKLRRDIHEFDKWKVPMGFWADETERLTRQTMFLDEKYNKSITAHDQAKEMFQRSKHKTYGQHEEGGAYVLDRQTGVHAWDPNRLGDFDARDDALEWKIYNTNRALRTEYRTFSNFLDAQAEEYGAVVTAAEGNTLHGDDLAKYLKNYKLYGGEELTIDISDLVGKGSLTDEERGELYRAILMSKTSSSAVLKDLSKVNFRLDIKHLNKVMMAGNDELLAGDGSRDAALDLKAATYTRGKVMRMDPDVDPHLHPGGANIAYESYYDDIELRQALTTTGRAKTLLEQSRERALGGGLRAQVDKQILSQKEAVEAAEKTREGVEVTPRTMTDVPWWRKGAFGMENYPGVYYRKDKQGFTELEKQRKLEDELFEQMRKKRGQ